MSIQFPVCRSKTRSSLSLFNQVDHRLFESFCLLLRVSNFVQSNRLHFDWLHSLHSFDYIDEVSFIDAVGHRNTRFKSERDFDRFTINRCHSRQLVECKPWSAHHKAGWKRIMVRLWGGYEEVMRLAINELESNYWIVNFLSIHALLYILVVFS